MRKLATLVLGATLLAASGSAFAAELIVTRVLSVTGLNGVLPIPGDRGAFKLSDLINEDGFRVISRPNSLLGGLPVFGGLVQSGGTIVRTTIVSRTPEGLDNFFNMVIR